MKEKDFHKQVTIGFSLLELLMLLSGIALLCGTVLLIRNVGSEMVIESGLVPVSIVSILYLSGQAILLILVFVQIHQLKKNLLRGELFDSENPRIFPPLQSLLLWGDSVSSALWNCRTSSSTAAAPADTGYQSFFLGGFLFCGKISGDL